MLGTLLFQLIVVLLLARVLGAIARRFGQPAVVAEIVTGIVLGPSVFGWLWPQGFTAVFPSSSLELLSGIAHLGLVFYMFSIGLEFDITKLRGMGHSAVVISHTSIVVPFVMGILLACGLYPLFCCSCTPFWSFALFVGAAMSVTAFPVLVRILGERGWAQNSVGAMATAVAAVDDVTAWCILAFVSAIATSSGIGSAIHTTLMAIVYIAIFAFFVAPAFRSWLHRRGDDTDEFRDLLYVVAFSILFVSAWTADAIGIHAIFGAFLAGAAIAIEKDVAQELALDIAPLVRYTLLPLFFVYSGLRTRLDMLDSPLLWLACIAVTVVAIVGKYAGSACAARLTGSSWAEANVLGILLNTRGLVELVVLNLGLDLGVLPPALFSCFVVMALVTTAMTGPLLNRCKRSMA